jgi:hypothetical protein
MAGRGGAPRARPRSETHRMANPFGPLYSLDFVALVVCAVFWFRMAQLENEPPWVWAGLSVVVYAGMWLWLGWGIVACLVGQVLVVALITGRRVIKWSADQSE